MALSDYFGVTTDYLLKGIDTNPTPVTEKLNASFFALLATTINILGLIASIISWTEKVFWSYQSLGAYTDSPFLYFHLLDGMYGGFTPSLAPYPQLGNSIRIYLLCWLVYFAIGIIGNWILYRRFKSSQK